MPAPWTRPERTALRNLWRKGLPPAVIAISLRAQFGHRYRAADIPGRVRDFGFLGEHPEATIISAPSNEAADLSVPPAEPAASAPESPRWPEAAVDRLKAMWLDGASGGAIATALTEEFGASRSRNAVMGMVHRLGLAKRRGRGARASVEVEAPEAATAELEALAQPEPISEPICQPAPPPAPPVLALVRPDPHPADWPPAGGIPMADLRWGECRWPVSGFRAERHLFCAAPATGDSPYCAEHRARAIAPREDRRPGRYPGFRAEGGVL